MPGNRFHRGRRFGRSSWNDLLKIDAPSSPGTALSTPAPVSRLAKYVVDPFVSVAKLSTYQETSSKLKSFQLIVHDSQVSRINVPIVDAGDAVRH